MRLSPWCRCLAARPRSMAVASPRAIRKAISDASDSTLPRRPGDGDPRHWDWLEAVLHHHLLADRGADLLHHLAGDGDTRADIQSLSAWRARPGGRARRGTA